MYDQKKKYDYIWLYFMLVMMATTRRAQTMHLLKKKGAEEFERVDETITCCSCGSLVRI